MENDSIKRRWFKIVRKNNLDAAKLYRTQQPGCIQYQDQHKNTALMRASFDGHIEMVIWLLSCGAHLDSQDDKGNTAVLWAISGGNVQTVEHLILNGGAYHRKNHDGNDGFFMAASKGQIEVLKWLLEYDLLQKEQARAASLLRISQNPHSEERFDIDPVAVAALKPIEKKQNKRGLNLLFEAEFNNHPVMVRWLIENIPYYNPLNFRDNEGNTLLGKSAFLGMLELAKLILDKTKQDLTVRNYYGNTAILLAVCSGNIDLVKFFLSQGANLSDTNNSGSNALLLSMSHNQQPMAQWLVEQGMSVTQENTHGTTPLMGAVFNSQKDIFNWYIKTYKLSIKARNSHGTTVFLFAAIYGLTEMAAWLLTQGSTKDEVDNCGNTALILTAMYGQTDMFKYLLSLGLSVEDENNNGDTAISVLNHENAKGILSYLSDTVGVKNVCYSAKEKSKQRPDGESTFFYHKEDGKTEIKKPKPLTSEEFLLLGLKQQLSSTN